MLREPVAQLRRIALERHPLLLRLRDQIGLCRGGVLRPVPGEHGGRHDFRFCRPRCQLGPCPAAVLRRIARQLHPVDREHGAPNQSLPVAHGQHGGEDRRDRGIGSTDEVRNGREVRARVPAEGDERHVFLAGPRNRPTAHDPARVGTEHDREQHGGRIRTRPSDVISEPGVEARQVQLMSHQMMHRVLDRAGVQLRRQIDGEQPGIGVDGLVARHGTGLVTRSGCERRATLSASAELFYSLVTRQRSITITERLMGWERAPGPSGYQWSFVALEYYALILNRTYKLFVTDNLIAGAIVGGWLPSPPMPSDAWHDPEFYPRERILRRYDGIDVSSSAFGRVNHWNFQHSRGAIADVEFTTRPKWGMGAVPYSGRIILYFRQGGSQELILLGHQDGPSIRDRLRPLVLGARLPWWHRWRAARTPTPEPEQASAAFIAPVA